MNEFFFTERGLYYRTNTFRPDRKTIVFVHGLSGSSSAWYRHEKRLAEHYNVLNFDLRGHGKSRKPKKYKDYAIELFADDLVALLNHLHIKTCSIMSHSFAALVVFEFLKEHRERVESAVFLSPSYYPKERLAGRIVDSLLTLSRVLAVLPFSGNPRGHVDYATHPYLHDFSIPGTFRDVRETSLRVYLYASKQALQVNYTDLLPNLRIPTLIVHGREDTIFPLSGSESMHKAIKESVLNVIPGADHIIVLNWFDQVMPMIEDFLNTPKEISA